MDRQESEFEVNLVCKKLTDRRTKRKRRRRREKRKRKKRNKEEKGKELFEGAQVTTRHHIASTLTVALLPWFEEGRLRILGLCQLWVCAS